MTSNSSSLWNEISVLVRREMPIQYTPSRATNSVIVEMERVRWSHHDQILSVTFTAIVPPALVPQKRSHFQLYFPSDSIQNVPPYCFVDEDASAEVRSSKLLKCFIDLHHHDHHHLGRRHSSGTDHFPNDKCQRFLFLASLYDF